MTFRASYRLWSSGGLEPAGTHQEGVGLRFPALHLGVVAQHDVVEEGEEVFVPAGLQLERGPGGAGRHGDGDAVPLQVPHQPLHTCRTEQTPQVT